MTNQVSEVREWMRLCIVVSRQDQNLGNKWLEQLVPVLNNEDTVMKH